MYYRDILLTLIVLGSVPFILKRPWIGALMWTWVSVMSPQRLTWGFAYNMPFAQIVALATLVGLFVSRDPKHLPVTPVTVVLLLLTAWMNVTLLTALHLDGALGQWDKVMKIMFMLFVTLYLLHSKQHVQILMWIVALSVAFYGVKGGLFTLRGGGLEKVWGPGGSFIEDNNQLALALIMIIPLLRYLQLQSTNFWVRLGLLGTMGLCGVSALGSQSRGALVASAGMLAFLWLKSRNKMVTAVLLAMVVPAAIGFMPESWEKRMRTMETYEEDGSAMGRINAWAWAIKLANDRPLGGGFDPYSRQAFEMYGFDPTSAKATHSIWFGMLAEHGYVGLLLFMLLWFLVWRDGSWIIRNARGREGWQWAADLARMIQVSLIAYWVGGTFLQLAYYDLPYDLAIVLVLTRVLLQKEVAGAAATPQPVAAGAGGRPLASPARFKPPLGAVKRGWYDRN